MMTTMFGFGWAWAGPAAGASIISTPSNRSIAFGFILRFLMVIVMDSVEPIGVRHRERLAPEGLIRSVEPEPHVRLFAPGRDPVGHQPARRGGAEIQRDAAVGIYRHAVLLEGRQATAG